MWQAAAAPPLPSPRPDGEAGRDEGGRDEAGREEAGRDELLWSRDPSRSYVGSENLPLRGDKGSTWEGGCKVPG